MQYNNKISTDLTAAVEYLRAGELVSFPTETVYGLGADANNEAAIKKVFQAKGRPQNNPLIVHIGDINQLADWAANIPDSAWLLAKHFWPGPLTLILLKQPHVARLITGGQDTVAIRVPRHPLTLQLLKQFGGGLAGPSANRSGHVSPTSPAHVAADLGTVVASILDGGPCAIGIESTIINLCTPTPLIMRSGAITAGEIAHVLQQTVKLNAASNSTGDVRTPGSDKAHYAPNTPLQLLSSEELMHTSHTLQQQAKSFSVLSFSVKPASIDQQIYWQQVTTDPVSYAHDLYANLRAHDQLHNSAILFERPPANEAWLAIMDRLTRASS